MHLFIVCLLLVCVSIRGHVCGYMWKPKAAIRSLPSTLFIEAGSLSTEPKLPSWTQLISPACLLQGPYSPPSLHWNAAFMWVLGPHHGASHLDSKHRIHGVISSTPACPVFISTYWNTPMKGRHNRGQQSAE